MTYWEPVRTLSSHLEPREHAAWICDGCERDDAYCECEQCEGCHEYAKCHTVRSGDEIMTLCADCRKESP